METTMKRAMTFGLCIFACAALLPATSFGQQSSASFKIADLGWFAGDWQMPGGGRQQVDEHWTVPFGGAMIGMSRTVAGGKMVEFEYLRIVERADGVFYISHPNARMPGTEFKLTRLAPNRATFENPQHDFPKRIHYQRNVDGSLTASIDGGEGTQGPSFPFQPMKK
jgi:hypothetical protein